MKKRVLALFLCLIMILSLVPGQALAQENETTPTEETQAMEPEMTEPEVTEPEMTEPEDQPSAQADLPGGRCGYSATWTFDEATGLLTISGSGMMYSFFSSDPYDQYDVHALPWKNYLTQIRSVIIEQGITWVGAGSFEGATNLTTVSLPDGLEGIGEHAFFYAQSLTDVTIPKGLSYMHSACFYLCTAMTSIFLPSSLKDFSSNALSGSTSLTDIYYEGTEEEWLKIEPPSTSLYNDATVHFNCTGLGVPGSDILSGQCGDAAYWALDLSTGVLSITGSGEIDDFDFSPPWEDHTAQILEVYIADGIENLPAGSFSHCTQMRKIVIPASVVQFSVSVFSNLNSRIITAGPIGSGCDLEFGWPEHIPAFAFEGLPITTIHIPITLKTVSSNAFNDCFNLTDIYYPGTPNQWGAVSINEWHNGYFLNADVHYGSFDAEVRYYSDYDDDAMAACFGGGLPNCFVADETDAAFTADPTALVGQYVLVEYTRDDDGIDTLISMTALETGVTTITTISSSGITIGEKVYPMDGGIEALEVYLGKTVLYHTLNDELVGIEILSSDTGYLTGWDEPLHILFMSPDSSLSSGRRLKLSPYADAHTTDLLDFLEEAPYANVVYYVDALEMVCRIEISGYSALKDGWCISNDRFGFGYNSFNYFIPKSRFREVFGSSYVATANASESEVFLSMYDRSNTPGTPTWGGNCYGMATTSILFYCNLLQWEEYGHGIFPTVNHYYDHFADTLVDMYAYIEKDNEITKLIERYAILQNSAKEGYWWIDSTNALYSSYKSGMSVSGAGKHIPSGNYIQSVLDRISSSSTPLMIYVSNGPSAHSMVIRTDRAPVYAGDGWYRVYIYDPNTPYLAEEYIATYGLPAQAQYLNNHSQDRYIELNPERNIWRYNTAAYETSAPSYWGADANDNVLYETYPDGTNYRPHLMWVYSIHNIGFPLSFDGTEEWTSAWEDKTIIHLTPSGCLSFTSRTGELLCEYVDGHGYAYSDDVDYSPNVGITVDNTASTGGQLTIPATDFQIEYISGDDISLVGSDFAFNIASDSPVTLDVSMNEGTVTVTSEDGGEILMQLTHLYSNSEYTSVVADGTLEAGNSVTLTLDENTFKGSLTGSGSLELLTDNHTAPDSRPLHVLTEGSGTVEIQDVTADLETLRVELDGSLFAGLDAVYADGQPCQVIHSGTGLFADVPEGAGLLVTYSWHIGDESDIHSQYPTGMKVYRITGNETGYTAEHIPELDELLQYSGSSIRITGNKGIRMITSITKGNKSALTGEGLAGYTLEEYGTALCWATDLAPGEDLVLGKEYTRSNYAYKKDVADPIFAQTDSLIQYTNVLVGFDDDQCIPDIVMRPYIILTDAEGDQVTLYGGSIHRSIGYIAWQNRNVFQPGSASYDYVWGIIHHVYGDRFDEDYKG